MKKDYSILIGGEAGQGSRKAGFIIARLMAEYGYRIFIYDDYQSLIRGGHNFSQIRASEKEVLSHRQKIDFLLALDEKTIQKHRQNLDKDGLILYDQGRADLAQKKAIGIDISAIIEESGGQPIMANIVLLAAFAKIIGINFKTLGKILKEELPKLQLLNLKIAKAIFNRTNNLFKLKKLKQKSLPLLTGNEAVGLGAVKAGLNLYLAYPMTPATGILHFLAKNQKKFGVAVGQLENELAVVNAALGAAYTGARTMVGTSGGGMALMSEALSLAAQSETPLVVVESQRAGPATGVPTYTAQGDLLFALTAGHGDFLKFVIAPGDAQQAYIWSAKILNLAWEFQTPAILLIDKEVSESTFSFDKKAFPELKQKWPLFWSGQGCYQRYRIGKRGLSPLAFPSRKGAIIKATSYEHDETGITVEDGKSIVKMQNKRLEKFQEMKKVVAKMKAVEIYGRKKAKTAIVAWGSTKGPAKEVVEKLGIKMIQPLVLEPFPIRQFKEALKGVEKLILVETNATGQLGTVLSCYGLKITRKILKYSSRPFLPDELEEKIKNE